MDTTRISVARVLDLDVPMSWREVAAVLCEAVSIVRRTGGSSTERPPLRSWLLTRGGAVELEPGAADAGPEVVVTLAQDLLKTCQAPDRLGQAVQSGDLLPFIDEFGERTSPNQRRKEIASLAWRALAAEADLTSPSHFTPVDAQDAPGNRAETPVWTQTPPPHVTSRAVDDGGFRAPVPSTPQTSDRRRHRRGRRRRAVAAVIFATALGVGGWLWWRATIAPSQPIAVASTEASGAPAGRDVAPAIAGNVKVEGAPEPKVPATPAREAAAPAAEVAVPAPKVADPAPAVAVPTPKVAVPAAEVAVPTPKVAVPAPAVADPVPAPTVSATTTRDEPVPERYTPVAPLRRSPDGTIDDPIFPSASPGVQPPVLVTRVPGTVMRAGRPPAAALAIEVLIDRAGRVEDARILGTGGASHDRQRAALAAARRWRFVPAQLNGQPVRCTAQVLVAN